MDPTDRKVLNLIQANFPIHPHPFAILGQRLGLSEQEVTRRVERLKQEGVIRRVAAVLDPRALGYASTLAAMKVPQHRLEEVAQLVSAYPEVTHNYARDHEYNLWFAMVAPSQERLDQIVAEVEARTGLPAFSLPQKRLFKIEVNFDLEETG